MKFEAFQESLKELERDNAVGHDKTVKPERVEALSEKFRRRNKLIEEAASVFFDNFDTLSAVVDVELSGVWGFKFERNRGKLVCVCNGMQPAEIRLKVIGRSLLLLSTMPFPSMVTATVIVDHLITPTNVFDVNPPMAGIEAELQDPKDVICMKILSFLEAILGFGRVLAED